MANKMKGVKSSSAPTFVVEGEADHQFTASHVATVFGYPALPLLVSDVDLYLTRRGDYGASELDFGAVMDALFPNGLTIRGPDDWARYGVLHQIVSKLVRYCNNFPEFDHPDSLRDIRVYAAMLQALGRQEG